MTEYQDGLLTGVASAYLIPLLWFIIGAALGRRYFDRQ